jgi:hypothetical protein
MPNSTLLKRRLWFAGNKAIARIPGFDVMVAVFADFQPFSAKKLAFSVKKCYEPK